MQRSVTVTEEELQNTESFFSIGIVIYLQKVLKGERSVY